MDDWETRLDQDGFVLLPEVFNRTAVAAITHSLTEALSSHLTDDSIRSANDLVYAARNVLALWPGAALAWRQPSLVQALTTVLGNQFGMVRALFFDKPPERTWALPWHKDLTIAVRDHGPPSPAFRHPNRKCGIPHVEAPIEVLDRMLAARIHLDDVTEANGPLKVIPGSHRSGKEVILGDVQPAAIHANAGDVLLMRPLVTHCSNKSHPGCASHRRVLHCEFASKNELAEGWSWRDFIQVA